MVVAADGIQVIAPVFQLIAQTLTVSPRRSLPGLPVFRRGLISCLPEVPAFRMGLLSRQTQIQDILRVQL